jgi:hypothetical protein
MRTNNRLIESKGNCYNYLHLQNCDLAPSFVVQISEYLNLQKAEKAGFFSIDSCYKRL